MSTLINPGTTPQVYTEDGRMVAAGGRVEFDQLDEAGLAAVDAGRLRVIEDESTRGEDDPVKSSPKPEEGSDAESTRSPARRSRNTSS